MDNDNIVNDIKNENEMSSGSQDQNFEFITETIKKKPINKRRIVSKVILTIILAVLFGVISCVTFVYLYPVVNEKVHPIDETKPVKFENADEEKEGEEKESKEAAADTIEKAEVGKIEPIPEDVSDKGTEEKAEEDRTGNDELSDEDDVDEILPPEVITQVVETVEKDLEIDDYTKLYQQIGEVATEAKRAMVTVTGVSANTDWFMNVYENRHTCAGIILAENGKEMLILTRNSVINTCDSIIVTFCDGERYDAVLKKSDPNTDMTIVAVDLEKISDETKEACKLAELGSTRNSGIDGTPVIAIGDPLGVSESVAMGQITSHTSVKDMTDTNVSMITTDIYGSSNASGVIINLSGRVLGIITQDGASTDAKNLICGYAISDLKDRLEKLSNGQEIAYLGIVGLDVTEDISEQYQVPIGAYVRQVVIDSPAMEAGIQNGDVIVKLGTTDITSFNDYKDAMLKCQPDDLMMVTVKRKGRTEYVELSYEINLGKLNE